MNKTKYLVLLTIFIDAIGVGIIVPVLPFYVERFTTSALVIASLYGIYSLFSFFSAPLIGTLSDRLGRKKALLASIFSTAVGWGVFALAPNILILFIGRSIDGIAAGNIPIAQAYLSDISKTDKERTANFGLYGAVFGVAFIIGPVMGALLGTISHTLPFWIVGALALANGVAGTIFLPETHNERSHDRPISLNPFRPLVKALRDRVLRAEYSAWFFYGLAVAIFTSLFPLFAQGAYGFNEFGIGIIYAAIAVVTIVNQAFLLKKFWLKRFSEPVLNIFLCGIYALGFLLITFFRLPGFFIGIAAVALCGSMLRAVMSSQIVAKADPTEKGEVLGVASALTSLSAGVAPLFAGYLFGFSAHIPFVLAGVFVLGSFVILFLGKVGMSKKTAESAHISS